MESLIAGFPPVPIPTPLSECILSDHSKEANIFRRGIISYLTLSDVCTLAVCSKKLRAVAHLLIPRHAYFKKVFKKTNFFVATPLEEGKNPPVSIPPDIALNLLEKYLRRFTDTRQDVREILTMHALTEASRHALLGEWVAQYTNGRESNYVLWRRAKLCLVPEFHTVLREQLLPLVDTILAGNHTDRDFSLLQFVQGISCLLSYDTSIITPDQYDALLLKLPFRDRSRVIAETFGLNRVVTDMHAHIQSMRLSERGYEFRGVVFRHFFELKRLELINDVVELLSPTSSWRRYSSIAPILENLALFDEFAETCPDPEVRKTFREHLKSIRTTCTDSMTVGEFRENCGATWSSIHRGSDFQTDYAQYSTGIVLLYLNGYFQQQLHPRVKSAIGQLIDTAKALLPLTFFCFYWPQPLEENRAFNQFPRMIEKGYFTKEQVLDLIRIGVYRTKTPIQEVIHPDYPPEVVALLVEAAMLPDGSFNPLHGDVHAVIARTCPHHLPALAQFFYPELNFNAIVRALTAPGTSLEECKRRILERVEPYYVYGEDRAKMRLLIGILIEASHCNMLDEVSVMLGFGLTYDKELLDAVIEIYGRVEIGRPLRDQLTQDLSQLPEIDSPRFRKMTESTRKRVRDLLALRAALALPLPPEDSDGL